MIEEVEKYKGIHPGAVLERELKKRNLAQRPFALSISEYPQSLNAITKGKRGMNTALALKIEEALGLEEGTFMLLQVFYEIKAEKLKNQAKASPNLSKLRKALFWDTDMEKIDWERHYRYVIERVFERGNSEEKSEMMRFYGEGKVKEIIGGTKLSNNTIPVMQHLKTR